MRKTFYRAKTFYTCYNVIGMKPTESKIADLTHPYYDEMEPYWTKFRKTFTGGKDFIKTYLVQYSKRETTTDYNERRNITYCPAHAKAAVIEIKNAIYQRMCDIKRIGGPKSYQDSIEGVNSGVDLSGNTMTSFIGRLVLPELLSIGKVGVYIDKPYFDRQLTKAEAKGMRPYIYIYTAEDIRSWSYDSQNQLKTVLLRKHDYKYDLGTGLPVDNEESFILLNKTGKAVEVKIYDKDSILIDSYLLNLNEIPFVLFEINNSLLTDVADYQIALLNLASSDMNYAVKSNYPFYTEQFDALTEMPFLRQATQETQEMDSGAFIEGYAGKADQANKANQNEIRTGVAQGRRYPKGVERPGFIHPSSEPLRASMEKQDKLKEEIRQLVNLAVTTIEPRRASAESKVEDRRTLEAGLSYIGLELEYGERQIGAIWCMYEGSKNNITIKYPEQYSLLTEEERRKEAEDLKKIQTSVPSKIYQKIIAKEIVNITIGHKVDNETLDKINKEIEAAKVIISDAETIINDHEAGLVSDKTASIARGYDESEVEQARIDHTDRLARIAEAQSKYKVSGVQDLSDNKLDTKNQKKLDKGKV